MSKRHEKIKTLALIVLDMADLDPSVYPAMSLLYGSDKEGSAEVSRFIKQGKPLAKIFATVFFGTDNRIDGISYESFSRRGRYGSSLGDAYSIVSKNIDDWHDIAMDAVYEYMTENNTDLEFSNLAVFDAGTGRFVEILNRDEK